MPANFNRATGNIKLVSVLSSTTTLLGGSFFYINYQKLPYNGMHAYWTLLKIRCAAGNRKYGTTKVVFYYVCILKKAMFNPK
jgi:hypothetical protein